MATDQYEDDIELGDELDGDNELDIDVLDDDADVDFADDDYDVEDEVEEEDVEDDDSDEGDDAVADEEPEVEVAEEDEDEDEDEEDDVVADDEDEEEDEETLEVLLGPDSGAATTATRARKDDSGDAPAGEGEFTCRSCFLVKRRAQLADADAMICLDCA